jgi:hypothetical protein
MPYLVRWFSEENPITLRCDNVEATGFLPNHVKLSNVQGIHDNAHPDLSVQSIHILRSEIVYVAEADLKDTKPDPITEPDTPKPAPTKRKRKSTKKA